ncbi:uncharacterized protein TNCV_1180781 [Trichonephila clavipes]|nr:uncharacterized protein TNCV_1180781 [Trichonephila clavipes]
MTLRRRSHCQRLTEFERGSIIELKRGGFSFYDIAERLGRNVSTVHHFGQQWCREEGQASTYKQLFCAQTHWACTQNFSLVRAIFFYCMSILESVNVLPWPTRSPDLSSIEHEWDIIGRQRQHHPQPELNNLILTDQEQHMQFHPIN